MGHTSPLEEVDREIDKVSWERLLGEDKIFMEEVLLLKRTSCSVGNFAAKLYCDLGKGSAGCCENAYY